VDHCAANSTQRHLGGLTDPEKVTALTDSVNPSRGISPEAPGINALIQGRMTKKQKERDVRHARAQQAI